ncbi:MAG TPA: PilZ domain-containing protein [Steroidobacteraceae bacterium]
MSKLVTETAVEAHEFQAAELTAWPREERRGHDRKSVAIRAKVTVYGKSVLPGHTVDLSQAGASFTVPFELEQGQECLIDLELEACGETTVFHIPAEVRYCVQMGRSRYRAGMRFGETDTATSALIESILQTSAR